MIYSYPKCKGFSLSKWYNINYSAFYLLLFKGNTCLLHKINFIWKNLYLPFYLYLFTIHTNIYIYIYYINIFIYYVENTNLQIILWVLGK